MRKPALRTRKAILPDAQAIYALIAGYARDNTLLPRTLSEIYENVRDFTVVERQGQVIGCGALHLYGAHLAEVRSIAVDPKAHGQGAGRKLIQALLDEAREHQIAQVCLFTRSAGYFAHLGFVEVPHETLPDKIYKDCIACPFLNKCNEVAMVYVGAEAVDAAGQAAAGHEVQAGRTNS